MIFIIQDRRKSYNGPRQYRKRNASYNSVESDANDSEIDEIETGGNVGRKKKRPTKKKKLIDPDENNVRMKNVYFPSCNFC